VGATVIDGKAVAAEVRARVASSVKEFARANDGNVPGLATVLVGDDPASQVYMANKRRQVEEVGMRSVHHEMDASIAQDDLLTLIADLNADGDVDGILVQLPLPGGIDQDGVIAAIDPNATVTVCHSRTRDLAAVCRRGDVLVAAVGSPGLVKADWVKPGAAVIDVGINRTDDGLVGDVDFDAVVEVAGAVTPVPGGVGPMTIAMLLQNTVSAARSRRD